MKVRSILLAIACVACTSVARADYVSFAFISLAPLEGQTVNNIPSLGGGEFTMSSSSGFLVVPPYPPIVSIPSVSPNGGSWQLSWNPSVVEPIQIQFTFFATDQSALNYSFTYTRSLDGTEVWQTSDTGTIPSGEGAGTFWPIGQGTVDTISITASPDMPPYVLTDGTIEIPGGVPEPGSLAVMAPAAAMLCSIVGLGGHRVARLLNEAFAS